MSNPVTPLAPRPDQRGLVCHGDNLEALTRIADDTVELIYIDPPYNTGHDLLYHDTFAQDEAKQTGLPSQL